MKDRGQATAADGNWQQQRLGFGVLEPQGAGLMSEIEDILLAVADPEISARFYASLLGCRPVVAGPDRALFKLTSGRALGLLRRAGDRREVCEVDFPLEGAAAVDQAHIDWWDRGARILTPPTDAAPGRSFVAGDPDGHRLRVYAVAA